MKITANMVIEALSGLDIQSCLPDRVNPAFERAQLLPDGAFRPEPDVLYVGLLQNLPEMDVHSPPYYCLCLQSPDDRVAEFHRKNLIVVTGEMSLERLFCQVQEIFIRVGMWVEQLQKSVLSGSSLETLTHMTEQIMGNTVNIADSALNFIAGTSLDTDDPLSLLARQTGHYPFKTVSSQIPVAETPEADTSGDPQILNIPDISPYTMVSQALKYQDDKFIHVVMVCDHRPYSPALLDLFQIFLEPVSLYLLHHQPNSQSTYDQEALFADLIEHRLAGRGEITKRAQSANVPFSGTFQLFLMPIQANDASLLAQLRKELLALFSSVHIGAYHQHLILLASCPLSSGDAAAEDSFPALSDLLRKHDLYCGVSDRFVSLLKFSQGFTQAAVALRYSRALEWSRNQFFPDSASRVWVFGRYSFYYFFADKFQEFILNFDNHYLGALSRLQDYDKAHLTDYTRTLYIYLMCERNTTQVGKLLHMHRNNVAYRVSRISDIIAMNLADPDVRLNLMLAYLSRILS